MATYTLIDSEVLASSQASVTFSAIPATYTDLVLRASIRCSASADEDTIFITVNGDTNSNYSRTRLLGNGSTVTSARTSNATTINAGQVNANTSTSNTFTNLEMYFPNYTSTSNRPLSMDSAAENNATAATRFVNAVLYRGTSAITSITFGDNFVSGSSFYLYGISNA
jgi:hypothetical protein